MYTGIVKGFKSEEGRGIIDNTSVFYDTGQRAYFLQHDILFDGKEEDYPIGSEISFDVEYSTDEYKKVIFAQNVHATNKREERLRQLKHGGIALKATAMRDSTRFLVEYHLEGQAGALAKSRILANFSVGIIASVHHAGDRESYSGQRKRLNKGEKRFEVQCTKPGTTRVLLILFAVRCEGMMNSYCDSHEFARVPNGRPLLTDDQRSLFCSNNGPDEFVLATGFIDIHTTEADFAKHPRDWEFVNQWWKDKPRDELSFWKRRAVAWPLCWLFFLTRWCKVRLSDYLDAHMEKVERRRVQERASYHAHMLEELEYLCDAKRPGKIIQQEPISTRLRRRIFRRFPA